MRRIAENSSGHVIQCEPIFKMGEILLKGVGSLDEIRMLWDNHVHMMEVMSLV